MVGDLPQQYSFSLLNKLVDLLMKKFHQKKPFGSSPPDETVPPPYEVPVLFVSSLTRDVSSLMKSFDSVSFFFSKIKLCDKQNRFKQKYAKFDLNCSIEEVHCQEQMRNQFILFRMWNTGFKHAVSVRQVWRLSIIFFTILVLDHVQTHSWSQWGHCLPLLIQQ